MVMTKLTQFSAERLNELTDELASMDSDRNNPKRNEVIKEMIAIINHFSSTREGAVKDTNKEYEVVEGLM